MLYALGHIEQVVLVLSHSLAFKNERPLQILDDLVILFQLHCFLEVFGTQNNCKVSDLASLSGSNLCLYVSTKLAPETFQV